MHDLELPLVAIHPGQERIAPDSLALPEGNQICVHCGKTLSEQVDYIDSVKQDWEDGGWMDDRPVRTGRVNDPDNLTASCARCNASKGARSIGIASGQWWPPGWGEDELWPFGRGPA